MDSATINQNFNSYLLIQESKIEYSKYFASVFCQMQVIRYAKKNRVFSRIYRREKKYDFRVIFDTL